MSKYKNGGIVYGPPNGALQFVISEGEKAINANGDVYRAERDGEGFKWVWVENVAFSEDYAFLLANVRDAVGEDE